MTIICKSGSHWKNGDYAEGLFVQLPSLIKKKKKGERENGDITGINFIWNTNYDPHKKKGL